MRPVYRSGSELSAKDTKAFKIIFVAMWLAVFSVIVFTVLKDSILYCTIGEVIAVGLSYLLGYKLKVSPMGAYIDE